MKATLHSSLLLFLVLVFTKVVWSQPPISPNPLLITELMYNSPEENDSLNFIEIFSLGSLENLSNYGFSSGIDFLFPDSSLSAGDIFLIVQDSIAFEQVYGILARQWGEQSNLAPSIPVSLGSFGQESIVVVFDTVSPWPVQSNGYGYSLNRCLAGDVQYEANLNNTGIEINGFTLFADPGEYFPLNCSTVTIPEIKPSTVFNLYPNPNTGIFTLDFTQLLQNAILRIRNTLSQIVFEQQVTKGTTTLTPNIKFNKGIYLLELDDGTICQHRTLVVID